MSESSALTADPSPGPSAVQAVVPPGLPDGDYALELHGPTGRFDSLPMIHVPAACMVIACPDGH